MRPSGSGGAPASAALPLLDNVPHCLRHGALQLPARRSERGPCYDSDRLLYWRTMRHTRSVAAAVGILLLSGGVATRSQTQLFDVTEKTIPELAAAIRSGTTTSKRLVQAYLDRIEAFDRRGPAINAIISINPKALDEAEALDRERMSRGPRGPLHGIPIILKDNYDTADMPTTAASIALKGSMPGRDAFQVRKLLEAGAVIVAKANLHEFARGITTISSLGGQTRNPYDPTRNPGGSSGGTGAAIAAARAIAAACFGCSAAATAAAGPAISGAARTIAVTIAVAAAGLSSTAILVTSNVTRSRSLAFVSLINPAALAGSSGGATCASISL